MVLTHIQCLGEARKDRPIDTLMLLGGAAETETLDETAIKVANAIGPSVSFPTATAVH